MTKSSEKIHQLLSAVGSGPMEDTTGIEATEYNWNQPHFFDRKQFNKLDNFTKKVAKAMTVKFVDFCHSEFDVTVVSTKQHFAAELVDQAMQSRQNDYYLAFGTDQEHPCGLISIPIKTAFIWATQLAKNIVRGLFPFELKGTEELCKVTLDVKKTDQESGSEAYILVLCSKLESVVGKAVETVGGFSAEDISKAILGHMQQILVCITAQLASTVLTLEEIMSLEVGDILLLDKKVNESIELVVSGQTAFRGRPAKSAGKHAVLITELPCDTG